MSDAISDTARRRLAIATGVCLLLGALGVVLPKFGLPAAVASLITLSAGALRVPRAKPWAVLAGVLAVVSLLRFVIAEAVPGVVQGGNMAASNSAVSRLRQIVFAQDVMRQRAFIDHDGDRIGSAGLLGELTGTAPLRGVRTLDPPLLARGFGPFHDTSAGPVAQSGAYLFLVCVPRPDGRLTAHPGQPIDDEAAERRFLAFAWPMAERGPSQAFAIDQHEGIFVSENRNGAELRFVGLFHGPDCEVRVEAPNFTAWRGKQPRSALPGDAP